MSNLMNHYSNSENLFFHRIDIQVFLNVSTAILVRKPEKIPFDVGVTLASHD